ncbi:MAG: hypothetical protein CMJ18_22705 [Phycisphaeraceae bacterium]|nr:hypothetical protein [Phycisphaeraceae bacterium]
MRVYIAVDTEGEACVVGHGAGGAETGPWQFEFVRRQATAEAAAAVEGARRGGATDVLVHDVGFLRDHAPAGLNLHYDQLPRGVRIALGVAPMKQVVALGFDAALLIGHHARYGVDDGVMAHSYSMASLRHLTLNGRPVGEIGIESLQIGALGVPVVMVSADEAGCREAKQWLGDVEVAPTKQGLTYHGAVSLHPDDACDLIRTRAARAVERAANGEFKPFAIDPPYELRIETRTIAAADHRMQRHNAERAGPRTVVKHTDDPLELW